MSNFLLISLIICLGVLIVMIKQINKITDQIDAKEEQKPSSIYGEFAAFVQEAIRAIKKDIDSSKETTSEPLFVLKNSSQEEEALEFLADTIRKLVFFETLNSKKNNSKNTEKELFEILSGVDEFLHVHVRNGEKLADELRDKFAQEFERLKNK